MKFLICIAFLFHFFAPQHTHGAALATTSDLLKKAEEKEELEENTKLIKILENPETRKTFIDNLKQLQRLQGQKKKIDGEKNGEALHAVNSTIIKHVNASSKELMQAFYSLTTFPQKIMSGLSELTEESARTFVLRFLGVFFVALLAGFLLELGCRIIVFARKTLHAPRTWREFAKSFVLSSLPLGVFLLSSTIAINFMDKPYVAPYVHTMMQLIVISRLFLNFFRILLQPTYNQLRFVRLNDRNAGRMYRFISLFNQVFIFGGVILIVFRVIGMGEKAEELWVYITGFVMCLIISSFIIEFRRPIQRKLLSIRFQSSYNPLIVLRNVTAKFWHIIAIFNIFTAYIVWLYSDVTEILGFARSFFITVFLIFAWVYIHRKLSALKKKWSHNWNRIAEKVIPEFDAKHPWSYTKTVPLAQSAYFMIPLAQAFLGIIVVTAIFEVWGINFFTFINTPSNQEIFLKILSIAFILGGTRVIWALVDMVANSQLSPKRSFGMRKVQPSLFAKTVTPILRSTAKGFVIFVAVLLVLSEFEVETMPIVYFFSILSLAISFGSQTLVKDLITGALTLFEGKIKVGEYVTIGENTGTVESITLRSVFLRNSTGEIHSIPFSEVTRIVNRSRDWTRHLIKVPASHATPVQDVIAVIERAYAEIKKIPFLNAMIIDPLFLSGVSSFEETGYYYACSIKTTPDTTWEFIRTFNTLLKQELQRGAIEPPAQHQVFFTNENSDTNQEDNSIDAQDIAGQEPVKPAKSTKRRQKRPPKPSAS